VLLLLQTDHEAPTARRNSVRQTVCSCSELFDMKTRTPKCYLRAIYVACDISSPTYEWQSPMSIFTRAASKSQPSCSNASNDLSLTWLQLNSI
jgi:hypothetical protein